MYLLLLSGVVFCISHCVVENCTSLAAYAATYNIYGFSVFVISCVFHDVRLVHIIIFLSFWHYSFLPTIAFIASDRWVLEEIFCCNGEEFVNLDPYVQSVRASFVTDTLFAAAANV